MGKKKKQFINKKTAHKFTLVHRSQRDPLQADDEAGQHVLVPMEGGEESGRVEENIKHGIYFDDDYDYMQHLRPRGEGMLVYADGTSRDPVEDENVSFGNVKLPADAFASMQEEDVGLLNKGVLPRGPQPDWDPDIVEALDDGVDFDDPDNFLDDDFIMQANGPPGDDGGLEDGLFTERREPVGDDEEWETDSGGYISSDDLLSDEEDEFANEETKSRFTNYSMTSSVIRRTEGLKVLDDRFERIMEEYDEEEIGCIEQEEIQGVFKTDNLLVNSVIDSYYESTKKHDLSETKDEDDEKIEVDDGDEESESEDDEKIFAQFKTEPKEKWDCESILSTYSNIYNHPKLIQEERKVKKFDLHKRTGIPLGVFKDAKQEEINEEDIKSDEGEKETVVLNNIRNKSETPEERKQRKKEVKEQRKNRRIEKKANKMAFKNELKKQEKVNNNTVAQKGIKL